MALVPNYCTLGYHASKHSPPFSKPQTNDRNVAAPGRARSLVAAWRRLRDMPWRNSKQRNELNWRWCIQMLFCWMMNFSNIYYLEIYKDPKPRYEEASHHIFGVFFLVLSAGKVGCRVASCEMSLIDARRQRAGRFPQIPAAISSRVLWAGTTIAHCFWLEWIIRLRFLWPCMAEKPQMLPRKCGSGGVATGEFHRDRTAN